jgi:hypothetical protein
LVAVSKVLRWFVAGVLTVAAFTVGTWVAGAIVLPHLVADHADRWVIAVGCGAAVTALAAMWGYRYATAEAADAPKTDRPTGPTASAAGERSISVAGNLGGIASTGDNAVNVQGQAAKE